MKICKNCTFYQKPTIQSATCYALPPSIFASGYQARPKIFAEDAACSMYSEKQLTADKKARKQ